MSCTITPSCRDLNSIGSRPYWTFWGQSEGFLKTPVNSWGLILSWSVIVASICCPGFSVVLESLLPQRLSLLLHAEPQGKLSSFWCPLRPSFQDICISDFTEDWVYGRSITLLNTTPQKRCHPSLFLRALCPSCHRWLLSSQAPACCHVAHTLSLSFPISLSSSVF